MTTDPITLMLERSAELHSAKARARMAAMPRGDLEAVCRVLSIMNTRYAAEISQMKQRIRTLGVR